MAKSRARKLADIIVGAGVDIDGNLTFDGGSTSADLTFADNDKANFGDASDLQIYHDGSNSYIDDAGTGLLAIRANSGVYLQKYTGETLATFVADGGAAIYFDNAARLATTVTGIDVTGTVTAGGLDVSTATGSATPTATELKISSSSNASDWSLTDSWGVLGFYSADGSGGGAGNRAEISVNMETATGAYGSLDFTLANPGASFAHESWLKLQNSASSSNRKVIVSADGGLDVTGSISADGLTVDGNATINATSPILYLTESDTTNLNTRIRSAAGNYQIHTGNDALNSFTARMNISHSTGDISFYEDTGTTPKFFWDAADERLGIGTTDPATLLEIRKDTANGSYGQYPTLSIRNDNATGYGAIHFQEGSTQRARIEVGNNSGSPYLGLHTGSSTNGIRIDSSGKVGIGDTNPAELLTVKDGNIKLKSNNDGNKGILMLYDAAGTQSGQVYPSAGDLRIWSPNDVLLLPTGNVGIGTSDPQTALHIYDTPAEILRMEGNDEYAYASFYGTVSSTAQRLGYMGFANDTSTAADFNFTNDQGGIFTFNAGIKTVGTVHNDSTQVGFKHTAHGVATGNTNKHSFQIGRWIGSYNKWMMVPETEGTPTYQKEFGFDFEQNGWFVEGTFTTDVVGVGETSPNAKFHVKDTLNSTGVAGSATPIVIIQNERLNTGSGTAVLRFDTNEVSGTSQFQRATIGAGWDGSGNYKGFLAFATNDSSNTLQERMRIDSSGNVGIGVTNPDRKLVVSKTNPGDNTTAAKITGSTSYVSNGNWEGPLELDWTQSSNDGYIRMLNINLSDAGSNNQSNYGLYVAGVDLNYLNAPLGIGGDNIVAIGGTPPDVNMAEVGPGYINLSRDDGADARQIQFGKNGTVVGHITTDGAATSYNTSSDQRLKDNIVDAPSASDDIDAIQVRSFDWKADGSHQKYGMVAQELQSVAPEAVSEGATEEDMMGVDYSKLVPMLVKEIQSLRARVAELEGE